MSNDNSTKEIAERVLKRETRRSRFWGGWLPTVIVMGVVWTVCIACGIQELIRLLPWKWRSIVIVGSLGVPLFGVWAVRRMILTCQTYRDAIGLGKAALSFEESYSLVKKENNAIKRVLADVDDLMWNLFAPVVARREAFKRRIRKMEREEITSSEDDKEEEIR
ncbi:MAG: hypothetical protein AMJ46_05650 [Latescibacteria bacterium DG_63]|nr:MAG: hypothetical protein AMJ46_05650 [Latescibacteria bacterium DG_63]